MTGQAALPMYDWPEVRTQTHAFWHRVRARLPHLPDLSHPETMDELLDLWRCPTTILADCCWGTVDLGLCSTQQRLARRSYDGVLGGSGTTYRSAIIARKGEIAHPADEAVIPAGAAELRWAANSLDSRSGWLAPAEDIGLSKDQILWTGAHRASIRTVATGHADIAAIDCRSWQLALAHEPAARDLVVIGWTAPRPGHFFMTGAETTPEVVDALRAGLLAQGQYPVEDEVHGLRRCA